MNLERLQLLEQYAREDPTDPFPRYALGLEWMKSDPQKAARIFAQLLIEHPDYLPVYYHAGHLHMTSGDRINARVVLEKGIRLATATRDVKTLAELQTLLEEI